MKISMVLSDVDGTLVTSDKRLTEANRLAVHRLHAAGIGFSLASSRPPMGLRMLIEPLALVLPMGCFNGGLLVTPHLVALERHLIPEAAASLAIERMGEAGVDIWVYDGDDWLVRNPDGPYVDRERLTLQSEPRVVGTFDEALRRAAKIVGVSRDFPRLAACEAVLAPALAGAASVSRSQPYYLDVTPPNIDKGVIAETLSRRLGIPLHEIATLGDMANDLPMFRKAGFAIAMGNATDPVKEAAQAVTASNDEDGFAAAIEQFILNQRGA